MQLVSSNKKKHKGKLVAKKRTKLVAKKKSRSRSLTGKPKRKMSLLGHAPKKNKNGGVRERSGRFSIFRPKVRGRAYPVQDTTSGWKLFDRLVKQSGLSGSDLYNLGMRLVAREFPDISKASGIALGKRLSETLQLAS